MTAAAPAPREASTAQGLGRRYRVRGPLPIEALEGATAGDTFVRTSYDNRSRAYLRVTGDGYLVQFEGFKKTPWRWTEVADVEKSFSRDEVEGACENYNTLALSPGYIGPSKVEPED